MQKIIAYTILLVAFHNYTRVDAQSTAPSLSELIDSALMNDYALMNQQLDIGQSALDKQELKDAFIPRLKISGAETFSLTSIVYKSNAFEIPQLNIRVDRATNRFTLTSDRLSIGADASMLIYSGGTIPLLRKAVDEKIRAQTLLTEIQKQHIISDILETYDQLALLKQIRWVLDESERRLAENMRIADKAFNYGLITKYDRQKIEVAQARLASNIEEYEGKRAVILDKLFLLTNIPYERLRLIDNTLNPIEQMPPGVSINNRQDLKALSSVIAAQQYKIKANQRWRIPKAQLMSSVGYLGSYFGHLSSSKPVLPNGEKLSVDLRTLQIMPTFTIGIGFSWNLFDGKDGKRQIERAELDLRTAQNNKADLTEKLELNLSKCRTDYTVGLSQVTIHVKQVEVAGNALDQATHEFRTGLIRSSDLVAAEEDFREAKLGWWQSVYNQRRAAVNLLVATGSLTIQSIQ